MLRPILELIYPWRSWVVVAGSLLLCLLLMPLRLPGMTIWGIAPNWLLIWLIGWSLNRPVVVAVIAGVAMGIVHDTLTVPAEIAGTSFSHAWGMALVAGITALLQKQRYIREDFISVGLIVFGMSVLVETTIALQLSLLGYDLAQVWAHQQRVTLISALLSSLWAPVLYFPLRRFL
jgi:rod shape-determining protein MreD